MYLGGIRLVLLMFVWREGDKNKAIRFGVLTHYDAFQTLAFELAFVSPPLFCFLFDVGTAEHWKKLPVVDFLPVDDLEWCCYLGLDV